MRWESDTLSGNPQFVDLGPNDHACLSASFRYLARALAALAFLLSVAKLGAELYRSGLHSLFLFPSLVLAATALCTIVIANQRFEMKSRLTLCAATAVLGCGFLFWQRVGPQSHIFGGRVAVALVALVFTLALSATHQTRFVRWGQVLAIVLPFAYSLFIVFDFILDRRIEFSGLPLSLASAFFLASVATIFAVPDEGPVAIFTMDSAPGEMSRRLVPAAMTIILLTAWFRYQGERTGLYPAQVGVCLFAVVSILLFIGVMQRISQTLSAALELSQEAARVADRDRELLEKRVQELEQGQSEASVR